MDYQESTASSNFSHQSTAENMQNSQIKGSLGSLIVSVLQTYVGPLIVTIGITGNLVSIMVFSAKSLRRLSSSVYVQAVLVSDTVFLLTLFALWLESFGYDAIHMNGICQSNIYLSYVGSFLSVWYVVCITIENYITICHPLKINKLCTFMRARVVTVSLAVASLFLFVVVIPITKPQGTGHMDPSDNSTEVMMCVTSYEYRQLMNVLSYIDSVITILIPMIIILILLTLIIISTLRSVHKKRKRMANKQNLAKKLSEVPQVRVAKLLSGISVSYILMNLPSHGMRLLYLFVPYLIVPPSVTTLTIHQCLLYISYSSYALKFFILYIFSGNFRKVLLEKIFCCFPGVAQESRHTNARTRV